MQRRYKKGRKPSTQDNNTDPESNDEDDKDISNDDQSESSDEPSADEQPSCESDEDSDPSNKSDVSEDMVGIEDPGVSPDPIRPKAHQKNNVKLWVNFFSFSNCNPSKTRLTDLPI